MRMNKTGKGTGCTSQGSKKNGGKKRPKGY